MKLNFKRRVSVFTEAVKISLSNLSFKQRIGIAAAIFSVVLAVIFHDSPILLRIGTVELLLIAFVVNAFVFLYLRRNWRANPYGRALMYSKISFALLANLSLITILLGPDWPWRGTVRVILFGIILFAQTRLLQLLYSLRNAEARDKYDDHHDSEGREI